MRVLQLFSVSYKYNCQIYHEGIAALSEAFKVNPNMKILNLNDNTITAKGAEYLAEALVCMQK